MDGTIAEIVQSDRRTQAQVDALLEWEGIQRDPHLDYTCGLFDGDGVLTATGSCFGSTLRCLAVDRAHRGEGLLNQVVTHLVEVQARRGNFHLFLYTKPESAKFFVDLGFYELARTGSAVFLENRRRGFAGYLAGLEKTRREGASAAAVMNANPFTLGHLHLVEQAAAENDTVHLFVLSEEAGPIPFAVRKKLVEQGVAHLPNVILHESGPYIISGATFPSYFLKSDDQVVQAHAELDLKLFGKIAAALGVTRRYVGEEPFSRTTDLYNECMIQELPRLGVECCVVPRLEVNGRAVSASAVRQAIHDGHLEDIRPLVPETTWDFFRSPKAGPVIAAVQRARDIIHH